MQEKVWVLIRASADGGRLGETYRYKVFSSLKSAEEEMSIWTEPIKFGYGPQPFVDGKVEYFSTTISGKVCWAGNPQIVYIEEKAIY